MHEGLGSVLTHPWEMAVLLQPGEKEEKALLFVLYPLPQPPFSLDTNFIEIYSYT